MNFINSSNARSWPWLFTGRWQITRIRSSCLVSDTIELSNKLLVMPLLLNKFTSLGWRQIASRNYINELKANALEILHRLKWDNQGSFSYSLPWQSVQFAP